ncbi:MAG: VacJ family lipoprotein [Deltaproteobacteria bacterium]|nr:VacJ family lipoprotein [Deltaproteobacteria bacterium]
MLTIVLLVCQIGWAAETGDGNQFFDPFEDENNQRTDVGPARVLDPLEPYNRVVFVFNDRFYFWIVKPTARGYAFVVPEAVRKGVKRIFFNLVMPKRFINCLLQGKLGGAGIELSRFVINSTLGLAGFFDPASSFQGFETYSEDTGQTLGVYGLGGGPYIIWPFLGPSSLRGTVGLVGDTLLDPLWYASIKPWESIAIRSYTIVNDTSLRIGEYEDLLEASFDPYIALRNAYMQFREAAVKK